MPAIPVRALVRWERLLLSGRIRRLAPAVVADVERLLLDDPDMTIGTLASGGRFESLSADVLLGPEGAPVPSLLGAIYGGGAHRRLFQEGLRRADPWDLRRFLQRLRGGPPSDVTVWILAADTWPGIDRVALGKAELTRLKAEALAPIHDLVERRVVRPDDAAEYVVNALLAGVHASAGRRMAQRLAAAGVDVAAHYRLLLDATPMAIVGLGEVGHRADASLVVRFLESADEDQRWAAVNALKLDPDTHLEHLVAALDDPSERMARAAAWRLRRTVGLVGPDRLFTLGARHRGPHAAAVSAYFLTFLPTDSLLLLLARRHGGSDDDRDFALQVLAAWRDVLDLHRPVAEHFQERLPSRAVATEISRAMSGDRRAARLLDFPGRRTPEGSTSVEQMRRVWDDIKNLASPDPDHPGSG